MGVSLQYHATRDRPVSESEKAALLKCISDHGEPDVEDPTESFGFYEFFVPNYEPWREGSILNGSTKVREAEEVDHWIELLAKCRGIVTDADWEVNLEGEHYIWNSETNSYDPPKRELPPAIEIQFDPNIEIDSGAFRALVAVRAGCDTESSSETVAEALRKSFDGFEVIRFVCDSPMASDTHDKLLNERLLWAVLGKLSYPGFQTDWRIERD